MSRTEMVLLVVVDGMRPDGMLQANAPTMRGLMDRGTYSLTAQSVLPSITLPTHMSMFHGVPPEVHGIRSNHYFPMGGEPVPGIIDLVRKEKRRAAVFYTWEELRDLWRPGSAVYSSFINIYGPDGFTSDTAIARLAADYLVVERPDFTFLYLGQVDEIGHRHGWMSSEYLRTIEVADAALGYILGQLENTGLLKNTTCLLTADHGGHDHAHGLDLPEDMTVPWILSGCGVKQGCEIQGLVRIYDTAPTIARLLELPIPPAWQGRPVLEFLA